MPKLEIDYMQYVPFAGKEELLAYVNRIREAGGANALEALVPSIPGSQEACLIARALNFGCKVYVAGGGDYKDGSRRWVMETPDNETTRRLAKGMRERTRWLDEDHELVVHRKPYPESGDRLVMVLPKRIGNAAHAFDKRHPEFDGLKR